MKYLKKYKLYNFKKINEQYYQNILKKNFNIFKKFDLKKNDGKYIYPNKNGFFTYVPSPIPIENVLLKYYKPNLNLLDIGCGIGNILELSTEIGYNSYGVEINKRLSKYHKELNLNVKYDNILNMDLSFLKNIDIIYLYRPIGDIEKSNILFEKIYKYCKNSCKIIYLLPHLFEIKTIRKYIIIEKENFNIENESYNYIVLKKNKNYINITDEKLFNLLFELNNNIQTSKFMTTYYKTFKINDYNDVIKIYNFMIKYNLVTENYLRISNDNNNYIINIKKFITNIDKYKLYNIKFILKYNYINNKYFSIMK